MVTQVIRERFLVGLTEPIPLICLPWSLLLGIATAFSYILVSSGCIASSFRSICL